MTRRGPQEGSIYLRQDGRWEGALHLGYENGKRKRAFVIGHSRKEVAETMSLRILKSIVEAGADIIATPCGLCQVNLELSERASAGVFEKQVLIPVLNIAQVVAAAIGVGRDVGVRIPAPQANVEAKA